MPPSLGLITGNGGFEEPVEFLENPIKLLAAQHNVGTPLIDPDLLDADLHLPAFGVQRRQFLGRG